jgi:hypothetical protein
MRLNSDRRSFLTGGGAAALVAIAPTSPLNGATLPGSSVSPMQFGAAGDGTTNDRTAVLAALAAAFDSGLPLNGGDKLYAVTGDIQVNRRSRPYVQRLRLKSLIPANDRQLLYFSDCDEIRIDNLYIHTGTMPRVGSMETAFGLKVHGGSGHRIANVEATGSGKLTYVQFLGCKDSNFENIYVHDGEFEDFGIAPEGHRVLDDVVDGIRMQDCVRCTLDNPIVRDLLGNATYFTQSGIVLGPKSIDYAASTLKPFRNMRTRGITGGGNDNCTIINPQIENVDQGFDFSGNGGNYGNKDVLVQGGRSINCASVGLKWGGAAVDCKVIGHTSENCGMYGYLVGGSNRLFKTSGVELIGCTAINPGYNDIQNDIGDVGTATYIPAAITGFLIYAPDPAGIEDVRLIGCKAVDKQGFYLLGDDPYTPGGPQPMWPAAGATTATLQFPWTGYSGSYKVVFDTSDYRNPGRPVLRNETRTVTLTNGSTAIVWSGGLANDIGSPFVKRPAMMRYGFLSVDDSGAPLPLGSESERPVILDDCESYGQTIARQWGGFRA